ncbi:MAG: SdrD B-like domain-containing protein [Bacteroidota bacterium]
MKSRFLCTMFMLLWIIVLSGNSPAQTQCDLSKFATYTAAGWSCDATSDYDNIGRLRDFYFPQKFPNGLAIGGKYTIKLTSSQALVAYLKGDGNPDKLSHSYVNPSSTESGIFGIQVAALTLNAFADEILKSGSSYLLLKDLVIASGTLQGKTVSEFLALANKALGGEDAGYTVSVLNEIASRVNGNFEEGKVNRGYLSCPSEHGVLAIGDRVWLDSNKNGIQDQGEPGIQSVTVKLYNCDNTLSATAVTNAEGNYSFTNLGTGSYYIKVVVPEGYTVTLQDQGTNDAVDSDIDKDGKSKCYTPAGCKCDYDKIVDAGLYKTSQENYLLGDFVWNDLNGNGIQDQGEPGIQGITVELRNCVGTLISNRITDANGKYTFINVPVGSYFIKIVASNYTVSPKNQGADDAKDSDIGPDGKTECFNVAANVTNLTVDAGLIKQSQDCTDLEVVVTSSKTSLQCAETFTYTVTVKNLGPSAASSVVVGDVLPLGVDYLSANASQGSYNSSDGKWSVGSLAVGASAALKINVKVNCDEMAKKSLDFGPAREYNVFVFENLTQPSADTQGKMAVGGDAYLANYSVGDLLPPNSGNVLVVGGNLTFISGAINNGNAVYGGTTNLPQMAVSITGGTLIHGRPIDFAQAKTYLQNLSMTLSGYTVNGTVSSQWGTMTLTGTDPFMNVFKISGSDLSNTHNLVINAPGGSVVIINVSGQNISWMGGMSVNGPAAGNIVFNFYQALTLKIQGIAVIGSVLAPLAALEFPAGLITGQVIVRCMTGSGQFNTAPFGGNISASFVITNTATLLSSVPVDIVLANNTSSVTVNVSTSGSGGGTIPITPTWSFGQLIYAFAFDGCNVYAATWGGKIYKSTDSGLTWVVFSETIESTYIWSLTVVQGRVFAATAKGIYVYNGTKWVVAGCANLDVHDIVFYNGVLYAATWSSGVYMSVDLGVSWKAINSGFNIWPVIQAITVAGNGDLYAATFGFGIYRLAYGTTTWVQVNCSFQMFWTIAASKTMLFAASYGDGLYQSVNGQTWTKVTTLPVQFIYTIGVAPCGRIYVSSLTGGIYMSEDNGLTWKHLGFDGCNVCALVVDPSTEEVICGTKSGEVYRLSASLTNGGEKPEIPAEFSLKQNYPNPFNPSTTIEFAAPEAGDYTLKVYDMLGREIATLLSGTLTAGYHKAVFNADKVPSGVYVYRLTGNKVAMSRKMMLVR